MFEQQYVPVSLRFMIPVKVRQFVDNNKPINSPLANRRHECLFKFRTFNIIHDLCNNKTINNRYERQSRFYRQILTDCAHSGVTGERLIYLPNNRRHAYIILFR